MPDSPSPSKFPNHQRFGHFAFLSRRGFCRHAVVVATTVALGAPVDVASEDLHPLPNASQTASEQDREADAKLANIIRKFGARLSNDQRQYLRRILVYNENMLASVRAFPLQNDDAPASVLKINF